MDKQQYFWERLAVRLAEAAEDEILRACFITGNITDQVKADIQWARHTLETADDATPEKLTIENATAYATLLEDMLRFKLRKELRKELGSSEGNNYSFPAGAIEAKVMFAIQSARNDVQAQYSVVSTT